MKRIIAAASLAAILSGCGSLSGLSTAKIKFTDGTNNLSIVQPKNVSFKGLKINPKTGELSIERYTSSLDAELAHAQSETERARIDATSASFNNGLKMGRDSFMTYMGQGANVNQQPASITNEQLEEAVRRVLIRQSNSTVQTITEVKPK